MSYLLRKADVLQHFGNNAAAVGRALVSPDKPKGISRIAVRAWPDLVPELRARQLLEAYPDLRALVLDPVTLLTAQEMRERIVELKEQP